MLASVWLLVVVVLSVPIQAMQVSRSHRRVSGAPRQGFEVEVADGGFKDSNLHILLVPGNPGLPGFYRPFITQVNEMVRRLSPLPSACCCLLLLAAACCCLLLLAAACCCLLPPPPPPPYSLLNCRAPRSRASGCLATPRLSEKQRFLGDAIFRSLSKWITSPM